MNTFFQSQRKFFEELNWNIYHTRNSTYYSKNGENGPNSYNELQEYTFLNIPSPKTFKSPIQVFKEIQGEIEQFDYSLQDPIKILRNNERTLFASTAGQTFDPQIYNNKPLTNKKRIIFQPCIRLQGIDSLINIDGFSTSFINFGLETFNATPKEHFQSINNLFKLFSNLGFYVSNLTLEENSQINFWNKHKINAKSLKINYGGLEIGMANYFSNENLNFTLSNVSVGFERFIWALNKTSQYFDIIGPKNSHNINHQTLDSIRTMTLINMGGKLNQKQYEKNRKISKKIQIDDINPFSLHGFIYYYYNYWNNFYKHDKHISKEQIYENILQEIFRGKTYISANNGIEYGGK